MAKFGIYSMDSLLEELQNLGRIDEVAPKMIDAAMPIVVDAVKKRLEPHRDTGNLINSVKAGKAKRAKNGGHIASTQFKGYDPYSTKSKDYPRGTPNTVKAMGLEYGSSQQQATPFLASALNEAEQDVVEAMQVKYTMEVGK